jgi:hypothetical protein
MRQLMHRDAAEGQSFVGDGGCGTLAPTVVGMRDRQVHNPTRRHIFAAVGVAVVAALFCGTATWASAATPSGDPGGRVLHQLTPTARALPGYGTVALPWTTQPTMNRAFITTYEPKQDSCGGMPGSRGWSQVVLQSWFTWRNSTPELFTHLGSRMAGLGHPRSYVVKDAHHRKKSGRPTLHGPHEELVGIRRHRTAGRPSRTRLLKRSSCTPTNTDEHRTRKFIDSIPRARPSVELVVDQ